MILDVNKFNILNSNQLEAVMNGLEGYADAVITDEIREFKHNGKKTKGRIIKNTETDINIMVNDKLLDYFKGYKLLVKGKTDAVKVVVDNQVLGIILPIRYKGEK